MTAVSHDLTSFLLARIAEDEEVARLGLRLTVDQRRWRIFNGLGHWPTIPPKRLLAECEAKRRIVERLQDAEAAVSTLGDDTTTSSYWGEWANLHAWRDASASIALPYAAHPDFREEWRL